MKVKWNGIEWGEKNQYYVYWFDIAENLKNRMIGFDYMKFSDNQKHYWICFWYFNVGLSIL